MFRLCIVLFFIILPSAFAEPLPNKVRVCLIDSELFPLWRKPGDEEFDNPGINIELQQSIALEFGHEIEWIRAPFPRCLVLLRQNEVDMLNVASYNADRERYGHYPKNNGAIDDTRYLKPDSYYAYVMADSNVTWNGKEFNDIQNLPVAIEIGASIRTFLNEIDISVYELSRASQGFGMLTRGRVAAVVTNQFEGSKYESDDIVALQPVVKKKEYYLMVSREFYALYPELSERIWSYSANVRQAKYNSLITRYGQLNSWH